MFCLVSYDVPARRTERYRRLLARYLIGVQESVFLGDLTDSQWRRLQRALEHLHRSPDHLLVLQSPNRLNVSALVRYDRKAWEPLPIHAQSTVL